MPASPPISSPPKLSFQFSEPAIADEDVEIVLPPVKVYTWPEQTWSPQIGKGSSEMECAPEEGPSASIVYTFEAHHHRKNNMKTAVSSKRCRA